MVAVSSSPAVQVRLKALILAGNERRKSLPDAPFERLGCEVARVASNDSDAVQDAIDQKPEMLIMDLETAQSFGFNALSKMKANASHVPALLVIAIPNRTGEAETIAYTLGADCVLSLPLRAGETPRQLEPLIRLRLHAVHLSREVSDLQEALNRAESARKEAETRSSEYSILRDSIIHNANHEMRTPLLQVKSSIAMLDTNLHATLESLGLGVMMSYAKESIGRLEGVLTNFSTLANSLQINIAPFRVEDAMNTAKRELSRRWASSQHMSRVAIMAGHLPLVVSSRSSIAQVLVQLIDNAIKFSPNEAPIEVSAIPTEAGVRLSVRDYGIGIAPEELDHIFSLFYQVDRQASRRYQGAGIGLAIVKLILDRLNIPLQVESTLGVGSTFSFVLPLARPENLAP
ncbi:MAG: hypothetical protein OHK0023_24890 [Anaerolineae bacterium]